MAGQVAYHLLAQAGIVRAPWEVTTVVACLPVLVLGMGSALAHLLRSDASLANARAQFEALQTGDYKRTRQRWPDSLNQGQPGLNAHVAPVWSDRSAEPALVQHHDGARGTQEPSWPLVGVLTARPPARMWPSEAYTAAARVIASGQRVSRRSLRSAGLHGSNADLGMLARLVRARPPSDGSRAVS